MSARGRSASSFAARDGNGGEGAGAGADVAEDDEALAEAASRPPAERFPALAKAVLGNDVPLPACPRVRPNSPKCGKDREEQDQTSQYKCYLR